MKSPGMLKIIRMETVAAASGSVQVPARPEGWQFSSAGYLEDYRTLYRAYLEDPDLQDARARWPFVCVWDNHEFAWAGYQSQYVAGGGYNAPAQNQKVFANQAWWEFIPAHVQQPVTPSSNISRLRMQWWIHHGEFNEDGLSEEPNNLMAINSLKIQRVLRWGKNVDLLLTDNWSFRSPDMSGDDFNVPGYPRVFPQIPFEIIDYGRHYNNGKPPDTIHFNGKDIPNPTKNVHAQTYLGSEQRRWFLEQLGASTARWKYGDITLAPWKCEAIIKTCLANWE
jgi:alkaline phosphatase D